MALLQAGIQDPMLLPSCSSTTFSVWSATARPICIQLAVRERAWRVRGLMDQTWKWHTALPITVLWLECSYVVNIAREVAECSLALSSGKKGSEFGRAGESLSQPISNHLEHGIAGQIKRSHQIFTGDISSQASLQEATLSAAPQAANVPKALL